MAPTSSKKVVSNSEAPAGAQKKLLTVEQREKKRASGRRYILAKKAKNSNTVENLATVTEERDNYRGQLIQCEKQLREAHDTSKEVYSYNGALMEQNRSLVKQTNELSMQVGNANKRWRDGAQNEKHIGEKWYHKLNLELPASGAKEIGSTSANTEVKEVNPPNLMIALKPSGMEMEMTQLAYNKLKQRYTASQESHAREIFSLTESHAEEVTVMTVNHHQELENLRQEVRAREEDLREALAREDNLKQELARIRDQEFTSIDDLLGSNHED